MALKFKRPQGFVGSIPRNWVDKQLPACPFCKKEAPGWEIAGEAKLGWNRYHFRCPACHGSVSVPVAAVSQGGIGPQFAILHAAAPKMLTIEDLGTSGSPLKIGQEVSVEELRKQAGG
jgi:hypothetical protein